jgi:hypothetical protein
LAMHRFRRVVPLILSVALLACAGGPVRSALAAGATPAFSDMQGHWSASMVAQATADGYVNGYPDGTFRPDAKVSRAELIKLMVIAGRLPITAPGTPRPFQDTRGHWVEELGYLNAATSFWVVDPNDYAQQLGPDQPATRLVATVMAVKLMGRQTGVPFAAPPEYLKVADSVSVPEWARGWVQRALADGVLTGYPDGTFRAQGAITRAEAVAMVQRTVAGMTAGVDPALHLVVDGKAVSPAVPLAVRDGYVYAPVQGLYGSFPYTDVWGSPLQQGAVPGNAVFRGGARVDFPVGTSRLTMSAESTAPGTIDKPLAAPIYRLFTEVMVPVAPVGSSGSLPWLAIRHDAATGTVQVTKQDWPGDSLPASVETATLCDNAKTEMAPGQVQGLIPPDFCDAMGHTLSPRNPIFLTATVDPSGPVRVRLGSGPWLTQGKVPLPWVFGSSEVGVLEDPSGLTPEGNFPVTFTGPGGQTFMKMIMVADHRPYRLVFDPITPAAAGQQQSVSIRFLDRRDRPLSGGLENAVAPVMVVTGPDGQVVAQVQVDADNHAWYPAQPTARFNWTPPGSGKYHLQIDLQATDQTPEFHAATDVTIP